MNARIGFLAGLLAGAALGWVTLGRPPRSGAAEVEPAGPRAVRAPVADEREGTSRLAERLERALRRLETLAPSSGETPRTPLPADDGRAEELRRLRGLERALGELRAEVADPEGGLQRLREARPRADWTRLDALLALWEVDVEAARREVQLLSRSRVLERYGTPDLTFAVAGGTRWVYGRDYVRERDAYRLQLVFQFEGRLVGAFYVERL